MRKATDDGSSATCRLLGIFVVVLHDARLGPGGVRGVAGGDGGLQHGLDFDRYGVVVRNVTVDVRLTMPGRFRVL